MIFVVTKIANIQYKKFSLLPHNEKGN